MRKLMKWGSAALCAACLLTCTGCADNRQPKLSEQPEPPEPQSSQQPEQQPEQQPTQDEPAQTAQPQSEEPQRPQPGETLAGFSTPLTDDTPTRVHNIILAAKAVAGITLQPGETFSFNSAVGARTAERGYQKAKVIGHGKHVEEGYGGGICQLSSTIYNAAANGKFTIVERHDHQIAPTYIQKGRDAAVVYGQQDFCFTNNRDYPVQLHCLVGGGKVSASITAAE